MGKGFTTTERRLILQFNGSDSPELTRIEFRGSLRALPSYQARGDRNHPLRWTSLLKALSLFFLRYLLWAQGPKDRPFQFRGAVQKSPAATLGDAVSKDGHSIHSLFAERMPGKAEKSMVKRIFIAGDNIPGKNRNRPRILEINGTLLPPESVVVFWEGTELNLSSTELTQLYRGIEQQCLANWDIDPLHTPSLTAHDRSEAMQTAYQAWIDLKSRKIGVPIDWDHDFLVEIYDSWYQFFTATRQRIQSIPVSEFKVNPKSRQVADFLLTLLSEGMRPHLTQWHRRFRTWYNRAEQLPENQQTVPQTLQTQFPQFNELQPDLEQCTRRLAGYADELEQMLFNDVEQFNLK